jgi:hypothetical protein
LIFQAERFPHLFEDRLVNGGGAGMFTGGEAFGDGLVDDVGLFTGKQLTARQNR